MKNEVIIFNNKEFGDLRTILNEDGSISVNAEDAAIGLGWIQIHTKRGKEYTSVRWERINTFCEEFGFPNLLGKDDYIPESLFYLLAMKAHQEKNLLPDKKVIALFQYLKETQDGEINPFNQTN